MAKGGYMCISYPEDYPPDRDVMQEIISSIEDDGGAVAYILHDRDVKADGSPVRVHYHIIAYWEKSPMPWNDVLTDKGDIKRLGFVSWMHHNERSERNTLLSFYSWSIYNKARSRSFITATS